jgi:hypothetical protein
LYGNSSAIADHCYDKKRTLRALALSEVVCNQNGA